MNYLDVLQLALICAILLFTWKLQNKITEYRYALHNAVDRIKSGLSHKIEYDKSQSKSKMDELQMKYDKILLEKQIEMNEINHKWEGIVLELKRHELQTKLIHRLVERKQIKRKDETKQPKTKNRKVGSQKKQNGEFTFNDALHKLEGDSKPTNKITDKVKMAMQEKYGIRLNSYIKKNKSEYLTEYNKLYKHFWYQLKKKKGA